MATDFDAIIIGTGQAGPPLAHRLAAAGMSVAIVERHLFGGTCVNTGCIPTKALVASAYAAHRARRAADLGIAIDGHVVVDLQRVLTRAREISRRSQTAVENGLRAAERCRVYAGHARFLSSREVAVGDDVLRADRFFINVGGRASIPSIAGIDSVPFLTNSSILRLETMPSHLVVIGGSYVGLEFAQMFRRFGADVTVVEMGPRLIGREDVEVSDAIHGILRDEGIGIRLNAKCIALRRDGARVVASVDCAEGEPAVEGSHLLLAVGRRPNTGDLGLEAAGVTCDDRGFIVVDDRLQTQAPGIWALGDCNGRGAFTHTAYNDFEIVADNLLDGGSRSVSDRIPAYALYIDPPLGRCGLTEAEARRQRRHVLVGRRPMTRVGRAIEKSETLGMMKVVVDADTREILGASILGTGGDEVVHCILDAMYAKAPYTTLQRAMHIHPTVSELVPTLLGELTG